MQRAYHLLHEVAKYHEVDLLAFHQPDLMRPLVPTLEKGVTESKAALSQFCDKVEFVDIVSETQAFGNYRLALKSLVTRDPYNINWLKSADYTAKLEKLLSENDYDLVHFDTISLVPYLKHIQRQDGLRIPAVLDHHNIESHMLLRRADNESNLLKSWYFRQEGQRLEKLEKQYCAKFSLNITCSEIDKQRLQGIAAKSRVEEVPNGVDIAFFKPNRSIKQERSLIFIGTLNWYPNVEAVRFIANELWPVLKSSTMGIRVDIIGAEPPEDITLLSEQDEDFNVHGYVDDIRPYMNKAAVYICPIKDGGGTKLKILDAMSMGMAVVAHPMACEGIKVEAGKNVLFAENLEEYVEAVNLLLNDEAMCHSMGNEARTLIKDNYSSSHIGKVLSKLYESCTSSIESGKS